MKFYSNPQEKKEAIIQVFKRCMASETHLDKKTGKESVIYSLTNVTDTTELKDDDYLGEPAVVRVANKKLFYGNRPFNKSFLITDLQLSLSSSSAPVCRLVFQFMNFSNNREMDELALQIETPDGAVLRYSGKDFSHHTATIGKGGLSIDTVQLSIPFEAAEKAVYNDSKVEFSFDRVKVKAVIKLPCKNLLQLYRVTASEESMSGSEIELVYDGNEKEIDRLMSDKSYQEHVDELIAMNESRLALKELKHQERVNSGIIRDNSDSYIEYLMNGADKLRDYCEQHSIDSPLLNYINDIPKHFDRDEILNGIKKNRDKSERQSKLGNKGWLRFVALFFAYVFVGVMFSAIDDGDNMAIIYGLLVIICVVLYIRIYRIAKPKLKYNAETQRFRESFNAFYQKRVNDLEKEIAETNKAFKQKRIDFRWYSFSLEDYIYV